MDLLYIVLIMLGTGVLGGIVNYHSDANKKTETESVTRLRSKKICILFGVAATILVPLFLKFAESKLLDEIRLSDGFFQCSKPENTDDSNTKPAAVVISKPDTLQLKPQIVKPEEVKSNSKTVGSSKPSEEKTSAASDYLIWTAYCLLAACAGMRFIDLLMSRVISKEYIKQVETQVQEKNKEINELEKEKTKAENNYQVSEPIQLKVASEDSVQKSGISTLEQSKLLLAQLPPVMHSNDPQKGRFGGKSTVDGKTLSVEHAPYIVPGFLNLTIKVTAGNGDLNSDVYLFLHNSFAKSIIQLNGYGKKEVEYTIPAYGAFTIGAILDHGNTLLELDIAELRDFPEKFRER